MHLWEVDVKLEQGELNRSREAEICIKMQADDER